MRNTKTWINFLWVLVVLLAVTRLATTAFAPSLTIPVVMASAVFALIHGALRYRWSGILAFLIVCLVVSNILENTSILTGFPFGHYHYTSGPMLFLVPWFIGPSYLPPPISPGWSASCSSAMSAGRSAGLRPL